MSARRTATATLTFVSFVSLATLAAGQPSDEFRVETDVFDGDQTTPVVQTLTLFSGEVIYDFLLTEPEEVSVFDVRRGRIVLLDPARQVQTKLDTNQLLNFTANLKVLAAEAEQRELFEPAFAETFDEPTGELVLNGVTLSYRAKGFQPKLPLAADRYREFADWYARLNAARRNLPPFGRIELNRALAARGLLPEEIARIIVTPRPLLDKKQEVRSQHTFYWSLSNTDRKRIARAGTDQATFRSVSLREYWGLGEVAARK